MELDGIRRIYMLGDLHLGVKNGSLEWSQIQYDFLINYFLKQIDLTGFDPEKDILLQVGDWHHVRESTNVRINTISIKIAERLCNKFKRGVFVILGNHDVYYKDRTDTHSLTGFNLMFNNFHIFENPRLLNINTHKILLLPWNEDHSTLKKEINLNSPNIVFCHADFKGFNLNPVTKLEHGLDLLELDSTIKIYSGHIHIRQKKGNVTYIGTPYELDRGDRGNTKGFYYIDISEPNITENFIENDYSPKYLKFDLIEILNNSLTELNQKFNGNFIDISVDSNLLSKFPITQFIELIKECGHRKLEFSSYTSEQNTTTNHIEPDSNYEYNIFTTLSEKLSDLNIAEYRQAQIKQKFKEIYSNLKNTKSYE